MYEKLSGGSRIYWGAGRCGEAAAGSTHGAQEVVSTEAEEMEWLKLACSVKG